MLSIPEIRELYNKRARRYDFSANLYYLVGFRENAYRKRAVASLNLQPGETVVEIGCGTGLNFQHIQKYIGPTGKIIGVDLTAEMLAIAKRRCQKHHWNNVALVEHDASSYEFPDSIDGVVSTFALTLIPEYKLVIGHAADALSSGKSMVVLDMKIPDWPRPLINLAVLFTSPFGVSLDIGHRHPWEDMQQSFGNLQMQEVYFGGVYLATSVKKHQR